MVCRDGFADLWSRCRRGSASSGGEGNDGVGRHTRLTVELMRLGIAMDWAKYEPLVESPDAVGMDPVVREGLAAACR